MAVQIDKTENPAGSLMKENNGSMLWAIAIFDHGEQGSTL